MFRNLNRKGWWIVIAVTIGLSCSSQALAKKPVKPPPDEGGELELVSLHPAGSAESWANAINDAGIVVGCADRVPGTWDARAEVPVFVPLLGEGDGGGLSINNNGGIVGWGRWPACPRYWANENAAPIDLPMPSDAIRGWANGVSLDGVVVGELELLNDDDTVTRWAVAWRVHDLEVFGPVLLSIGGARDVALLTPGLSRAVGRSADVDYGNVATAWDFLTAEDGTFTVLGSTVLIPDTCAEAYAVTSRGDVTGIVQYGNTAFVIREGSLTLLFSGRNNEYGIGYDLNDSEVVGRTGPSWLSSYMTATQWNSRNRRQDLVRTYFGDGWSTTSAEGINASGEMVGSGTLGAWLLRRQ